MNASAAPSAELVSTSELSALIESTIREALGVIRPGAANLDGDADLAQEADLDSAEVMDLIMEIEDRLDISVPVETMAQSHTINELCAGIFRLKQSIT
jgi:acyl carrier protein